MVGYSILDAIGDIARMGEVIARDGRVDRERRVRRHVSAPVYIADNIVKLIRILGRELDYRLQDSESCPAAEVGLIHHLEITLEADHPLAYFDILCSESDQLVPEDIFKTLEGLGYHGVDVFHLLRT